MLGSKYRIDIGLLTIVKCNVRTPIQSRSTNQLINQLLKCEAHDNRQCLFNCWIRLCNYIQTFLIAVSLYINTAGYILVGGIFIAPISGYVVDWSLKRNPVGKSCFSSTIYFQRFSTCLVSNWIFRTVMLKLIKAHNTHSNKFSSLSRC